MKKLIVIIAILLAGLSISCYSSPAAVSSVVTNWEWKEAGNFLDWKPAHFASAEVADGVLRGVTEPDSHLLSPFIDIDAEQWSELQFSLKSTVGGSGQIFFRHKNETMSAERQINFTIVGDGQFHTYRVKLSANAQWKGKIIQIRFDPLDPGNAHLEVQYLRFLPPNNGGLVSNGGFELTDAETSLPENWSFENSNPQIVPGKNSPRSIHLQTGAIAGKMSSAIFEFPAIGKHQLSFDYQSAASVQLSAEIQYFDIFNHLLKPQQQQFQLPPGTSWQSRKSTFDVPPLAAYGRIIFTIPEHTKLSLDNISVKDIPKANWQANWIMAADAASQSNAPRYFRKSFTLPQNPQITRAKIQVTADDAARVFVNGHELPAAANWNNWKSVDMYDIKSYLQNGKNVIGISTQNNGGAEGLLAELNIQYAGGEIDINTDKSWQSFAGNASADWSKSTFDASAWNAAKELGQPPVAPWADVPYLSFDAIIPQKAAPPKSAAATQSPVTKVVYLPGNVPAFEINGKIFPVMHVMTHTTQYDIVKNSRDNNINLIWLNVARGIDLSPNAVDRFAAMDKSIEDVLADNPQAYIVLNVPLDLSYISSTKKWMDSHPDQLVQKADGSTDVGGFHGVAERHISLASPDWQRDAGQALRALVQHVRASSYASQIIGYAPLAGISWEWLYWGSQNKDEGFVDYSEPFTQAFANWAKTQYHDDLALLNTIWKTHYASFDAIKLPSKAQRMEADYGTLLDPAKSGQVIDLREFFTQVISGDILQFCHIVKEETDGTAICGTYYGYVMYIGRPYFGVHSGHYALEKVLSSPDIDFLMSPSRYEDRGIGGGSGFMTTVDSFKLHKKVYIDQADIRTFLATGPGSDLGKLNTLKDSVSVLEREFCNTIVNGAASQWFGFGKGWLAADTRIMQAVGKMRQIEKELQQTPRETMDAPNSIAVINGEKSILYTKVDSTIQDAAVNVEIEQLNRTGVAWDSYLLSDLPRIKKYRYYLFLNCFDLTDAQKQYIDSNLKKDGNVLVWIYAPGIIQDGKSTFAQAAYTPDRVSEVTGFKLAQIAKGPLRTMINQNGNLLQHDILLGTTFGDSTAISPRFAAQDGLALGHFRDNNQTSLAVKKFDNWTSIYSAAPTLPAALLRNIAKLANVPVINNHNDDITYASKRLFAVHSLSGGKREFTVGNEYKSAKELFSDQSYVVKNGRFSVDFPNGGTMLFLLSD